jgi:hypothetical protein
VRLHRCHIVLTSRDASPAPPVILISSHAEEDYASLVADTPAVGFLPKAALSAMAIRQVLDDRDPRRRPWARCGD